MPAFILTWLVSSLGPQWLFKIGAIVAGAVALFIGYQIWHHKVYMEGWNDHEAAIVRQDKKAVDAALAKRSIFNDCRARGLRWEQTTGQCIGG